MKINILEKLDNIDDIVLEQELSSIFSLLGLYDKRLDMEYYMNLHGQQIVFEQEVSNDPNSSKPVEQQQSAVPNANVPNANVPNANPTNQTSSNGENPAPVANANNPQAQAKTAEESKSAIRKILELLPRAIRAVAQFIANMMNKLLGDVEAQRVESFHKTLRETPGVKEALDGMTDEQAASLVANMLQAASEIENNSNTPPEEATQTPATTATPSAEATQTPAENTQVTEYALIQEDVDQLAIDKMAADKFAGKTVSSLMQQGENKATSAQYNTNTMLTNAQNVVNNVAQSTNAAGDKLASIASKSGNVDASTIQQVLQTIATASGDATQLLDKVAQTLKIPFGIISWIRNAKNLVEFIETMYYDMKLTIKSSIESAVDVAALNIQRYVDKLNPVKNQMNINNKGIQIVVAVGDLQNAMKEGQAIDEQLAALDTLLNKSGGKGMTQFVQSAVQKVGIKNSLTTLQKQVFRLQKTIDDKNSPFGQWINRTMNAKIEEAYGDQGEQVTQRSQYSEQLKNSQGYVKLLLGMTTKANKVCGLISSGVQAIDKLTRLLGRGVKKIADIFASGLTEARMQQERRELEFEYRHSPELQQKLLAEFDERAALWGTNREDVAQQYQRDVDQYKQAKAQNDAAAEQQAISNLENQHRGLGETAGNATDIRNTANAVHNVATAARDLISA